MAPFLFALALFAQDAPAAEAPSEGPMATAVPRKQEVAALPIQGGSVSAPTDDYSYVGWCYGAISAYVELYDRAMPEVTRIERAWPTPGTEENISKVYPGQRDEAKKNLVLFAKAMEAAEKASPSPIQAQGADAVRRGRAMWTGATSVPKAQLAQFWMSWSPPAKCEETAKALEARSLLFGQALTYNAAPVVPPAPPSPAAVAPAAEEPAAAPVETPSTDPDATPTPEAQTETPSSDVQAIEGNAVPSMTPVPVDAAGAPADTVAASALDDAAPAPSSAIDDLLPAASNNSETPAATNAAPPVDAAPAPATAAPTTPVKKRKRGLKETLTGMRGAQ